MCSCAWLLVLMCLGHAGGAAGSTWCRPNAGRCNGVLTSLLEASAAANPFQAVLEASAAANPSQAPPSRTLSEEPYNPSPEVVDWDCDGHLDLIIGNADGRVRFFKGAQGGSLVEAAENPFHAIDVGSEARPRAMDWDGDGHLDLIVGSGADYSVRFFRGAQNGSLAAGPAYTVHVAGQRAGASPEVVDWDGDGRLDLLIGDAYGRVQFFKGTQTQWDLAAVAPAANPFQAVNVGGRASLEAVDWDGDGHLDLLVGNDGGQVRFFRGAQDGSLVELNGASNPFQAIVVGVFATLKVVDWDCDGHLDLLVGSNYGQVNFFMGAGAQGGSPAAASAAANPFQAVDVAGDASPEVVDWDGDGRLDLLVGNADGRVRLFRGTQDGSLVEAAEDPFQAIGVRFEARPMAVDWDGDGNIDLIVGTSDGQVRFFRRAHDGSLAEPEAFWNPFQAIDVGGHANPEVVDWDGDGNLDLIVGNADGRVRFFQRAQDGSLAEPGAAANPFQAIDVGSHAQPEVADWDGDGRLDLLIGDAYGKVQFFSLGCDVEQPCSSPHGVCGPYPHVCQCLEGYSLADCSGCAAGFYTDWNTSNTLQHRHCRACPTSTSGVVCWRRGRCHDDVREQQARGDIRAGGSGTCECNPFFHGTDQEGRATCELGECPPAHHYTISPSTQLYECQRCPEGHGKRESGNALPCHFCGSNELWDGLCTPCDRTAAQVPSADRRSCVPCGLGEVPNADGSGCSPCGLGEMQSATGGGRCVAWWPYPVVAAACVALVATCALVICRIRRRRAEQRRREARQRAEDSESLGVSLFYVLRSFKARLRIAMDLVEWRADPSGGEAYTLGSFVHLYGGSADSPPREWREATASAAPEDPSFVQMAPVMAYGRFAEGRGKRCPRDGRMDCSIVDGVLGEGSSGRANTFVSWVWTYKLSAAQGAWRAWESAQRRANPGFDPRGTFVWWCFFCNNQFRVMQDRSKRSTEHLAEAFEARVKSIGTMHIMMESLSDLVYARRLWCIFEVLVASRNGISCSAVLPEDQLARAGGISELSELLMLTEVDAAHAKASEEDDERGIREIITGMQGSFQEVNRKVQASLCTPIIDLVRGQADDSGDLGDSGDLEQGLKACPSRSTSTPPSADDAWQILPGANRDP